MTLPVIILVGGLATRLRPLTNNVPKALIRINGKPFIAHQLELLRSAGIQDIIICAWYKGKQVEEFAGDGDKFGLRIRYSFDGEQPLGTGGAIRKALPMLEDAFFVLYGDSYLPVNYREVEAEFYSSGRDALMTVYHNLGEGDRSNVWYENGMIRAYDKLKLTKQMEYIDYGLGVFRKSVFEACPENEKFDLASVYQDLITKDRLAAYEAPCRFYEVGSFKGIRELEEYLLQKHVEC